MLTLLTLTAALAMQDPPAPPPPPPPGADVRVMVRGGPGGHGPLDKDGDGQVTREEFAAPMNDAFAMMDKDNDGRLSTEELTAGHGPMGDGDVMFMRRPGGPGEGMPHRFELHRDGAGEGPGEERVVVLTDGGPGARLAGDVMMMRHPGGPGGEGRQRVEVRRHGPDGAPGEERVMVFSGGDMPMIIGGPDSDGPGDHRVEIRRMGGPEHADMDRNGDGKISEDEFVAPLRDAFARMDADHSGFIEGGEHGAGGDQVHVFTHRMNGDAGHHDGDDH